LKFQKKYKIEAPHRTANETLTLLCHVLLRNGVFSTAASQNGLILTSFPSTKKLDVLLLMKLDHYMIYLLSFANTVLDAGIAKATVM
jgi:hypothetical protein